MLPLKSKTPSHSNCSSPWASLKLVLRRDQSDPVKIYLGACCSLSQNSLPVFSITAAINSQALIVTPRKPCVFCATLAPWPLSSHYCSGHHTAILSWHTHFHFYVFALVFPLRGKLFSLGLYMAGCFGSVRFQPKCRHRDCS